MSRRPRPPSGSANQTLGNVEGLGHVEASKQAGNEETAMAGGNHGSPEAGRSGGGIAWTMATGAIAGAAATAVMDVVDQFLYEHEPERSRRQTWAVRPEGKDPAHVIASRASEALGTGRLPQSHPAGDVVHYGIGILPAALYAVLRERVPAVGAGRGLAYGLAMFLVEDELANPALGFAAPPGRYPWQPHARGLIAHLVYGLATELALSAMDRADRSRGGRPRSFSEEATWREEDGRGHALAADATRTLAHVMAAEP